MVLQTTGAYKGASDTRVWPVVFRPLRITSMSFIFVKLIVRVTLVSGFFFFIFLRIMKNQSIMLA